MLKGHLRVLEARNLLDLINARQKIIIWPKSALHNPGKILCREWPKNRKTGKFMRPRVFGYGSSTGYNTRWKTICKRTGIQYLSAHPAGRHGFFTELVVRQGVDPVTAAKAGRWSDPNLPMRIYAHAETDEADVRARFRTNHVQDDPVQTPKQQKSKKE
jgi:integrase